MQNDAALKAKRVHYNGRVCRERDGRGHVAPSPMHHRRKCPAKAGHTTPRRSLPQRRPDAPYSPRPADASSTAPCSSPAAYSHLKWGSRYAPSGISDSSPRLPSSSSNISRIHDSSSGYST